MAGKKRKGKKNKGGRKQHKENARAPDPKPAALDQDNSRENNGAGNHQNGEHAPESKLRWWAKRAGAMVAIVAPLVGLWIAIEMRNIEREAVEVAKIDQAAIVAATNVTRSSDPLSGEPTLYEATIENSGRTEGTITAQTLYVLVGGYVGEGPTIDKDPLADERFEASLDEVIRMNPPPKTNITILPNVPHALSMGQSFVLPEQVRQAIGARRSSLRAVVLLQFSDIHENDTETRTDFVYLPGIGRFVAFGPHGYRRPAREPDANEAQKPYKFKWKTFELPRGKPVPMPPP